MTWTENSSRFWLEEFVAKVRIPPEIDCPSETCKGAGVKAKWHACSNKNCCWFYCDECKFTTWLSPTIAKGALGSVVKWKIRATRWVG